MFDAAGARAGLAAALIAAFAYGVNIIGAKIAAAAGLTASVMVFYRVLLLFAVAALYIAATRGSATVSRASWPALIMVALVTAGMGIAYLSSVAFIPVTVAVVIFYIYPVLIVLSSPLATGRRFEPRHLGVAAIAFAGIALVVGPSFDALDPRGLALALIAAALTVCQFFLVNRLAHENTAAIILWTQLGVTPIAALVAMMSGGLAGPAALALAPGAAALTIVGYVIGFAAQMYALTRLNAVAAGLVFCLEPVIAAITSALLLDERLTAIQYAGGALVIAAVIATVFAPARELKPT